VGKPQERELFQGLVVGGCIRMNHKKKSRIRNCSQRSCNAG